MRIYTPESTVPDRPGLCVHKLGGPITVTACTKNMSFDPFFTQNPVTWTTLHELLHCCGIAHGDNPVPNTCNNLVSCCILKEAGLVPKGTKCKK